MSTPSQSGGSDLAAAMPGIDLPRVTGWMVEHLPDLGQPLTFTRVGAGQSNMTYRVETASGRTVVLRRPPLGEILASAHDMAREHRVLTGLATARMPVPTPLGLCEDVEVTGAPFYVMDHVDGLVTGNIQIAEQLTPQARSTAGLSLASTLARLQLTDLDASGLGDMRRPGSYSSRQLRRWRKQWESSRTRELPLVDQLADRLEANMPEETASTLVHGDYHLFNAILGEDGAVRVIVDWELCTVGDPLGDVGLMIAYWNELGKPASQDSRLFREPITELPGFPSTAEMIAEYARASGRDVSDVGFWVAFAYWKIAIITEGVYRRWLDDPANGTNPGHLGASIERLVGLADQTAAEASI